MKTGYPDQIVDFLGANPTPEQWDAISYPLEPFVLVAGAGSGKTSVMAARVIYLAMAAQGMLGGIEGVMPGNVLCLTFTNKATENLALRIRKALGSIPGLREGEEPEVLNYHGFAAQVIERHGMRIGAEPGQRVVTQAQRNEIAARVLDEMAFEHQDTRWQPSIVQKILLLDEQLQNHLREPDEVIAFNEDNLATLAKARSDEPHRAALERIELAHAVTVFRRIKRELGVIDFGDQIEMAVRIATEHPAAGASYRERFGAVLLDEYQDTNHAQAELMRAIFGGGHPVTAVGDPDQNIYAWRGASLHNLLAFPEQFARADGSPPARLPLYTNFRSGARILQAADQVIRRVPDKQRPDPSKALRPHPPNGEGAVAVNQYEHEVAEAEAVAERILGLHEDGLPWREIAVLCRTHRLYESLQVAFEGRIPAEFIGLAGLTKLPEVVEVLAYARVASDPQDSVALARVLTGPRYRVGIGDLARVAAWTRTSRTELLRRLRESRLDEDDDLLEDQPFLIAEALEHLDEVEGLSDEARVRLEAFGVEMAELRDAARRPVADFLAHVIRRTGLLHELDAEVDAPLAAAKRRNLAAFLDQVHAFQPVSGDLTLSAFLAYLDQIEDDREFNPVQPSDDDSVKVMTVHAAKGLEFDTILVPGLAKGLFPDDRVQQNPTRKGSSLDVELRRDRDLLPSFDGNMSAFWKGLKDQEVFEERRTAYVALTRAKQRLFVSSALWYGERIQAQETGAFFAELAAWGRTSKRARVTFEGEMGDENPLKGYRQSLVRPWPGPALRSGERDDLFPNGWRQAALEAAGETNEGLTRSLWPEEHEAFTRLAAERRTAAQHLIEREQRAERRPASPDAASVASVIDYARCPKRFYWSAVQPLPRFSGPAARIGTEVHRWIERQSRGQATLLEIDELPDLTDQELAGEPGRLDALRSSFLQSRFASMVPLYVERPFLLSIDGFTVRGRIDAIFGEPDGPWEVVDYKTGKRPPDEDALTRLQLDLYALACAEVWHRGAEDLTLTYLYLATGEEASHRPEPIPTIRERVRGWLAGIVGGRFEPTPGAQCHWCDFLPFCDAGRRWVDAAPDG
jgi:DNA helicase II / ATP-dependent DNA helicase PcrA